MERLLNGRSAIAVLVVLAVSVAAVALWAPRPARAAAVPAPVSAFSRPLAVTAGPEGSAISVGLTTEDQTSCLLLVFDPPSADPDAADHNKVCIGDGSNDIFGAGSDGASTASPAAGAGVAVAAAWTWLSPASGERYDGWFGTADNGTQAFIADADGHPVATSAVVHRVYILVLPAESPMRCLRLVSTSGASQASFPIDECAVWSAGFQGG